TAMVPLFSIEARDWSAPDPEAFDAVLMTSANAAGEAGAALAPFTRLPVYAVGEATGRAARGAGFGDVVIGAGTSGDAAHRLRADGRRRVLHLAGEEVRDFDGTELEVTRIAVYASVPTAAEGLEQALAGAPIALVHSPRAGGRFAELCDERGIPRQAIALVAISAAALAEAGANWRVAAAAAQPNDAAMLAAAAGLAG
ncbi:MAG: uroporphyrinogen-III synthase, partial [Parasphingopyxis sp.]